MDDLEKIIDQGCRCIAPMNDAQGFGIELLTLDVVPDRDE